jgi:hypothetical protein
MKLVGSLEVYPKNVSENPFPPYSAPKCSLARNSFQILFLFNNTFSSSASSTNANHYIFFLFSEFSRFILMLTGYFASIEGLFNSCFQQLYFLEFIQN